MRLLATLALVGCASTSFAGVMMRMENRDLQHPGAEPQRHVYHFQDGAFRVEELEDNEVQLFRDQVLYSIDTRKKTYRKLDKAQMDKLGGQLSGLRAQMDAQMAKLPAAQRQAMEQAMEQAMGKMGAANKPPSVNVRDTGRSETVAGYGCRVWEVLSDGRKEVEVCAAAATAIPGGADMMKSMREISTFTSGLSETIGGKNAATYYWSQVTQLNGVPILARDFDDQGKPESELRVVAVESGPLPTALFTLPAGFTEKKLPALGGDDDDDL